MKFEVTAAGRIFGVRAFKTALFPSELVYVVYDESEGTVLAAKSSRPDMPVSNSWQAAWLHPIVRPAVGTTYRLYVLYQTGSYWRNNAAIGGAGVTRNGIKMISGFQTTSLNFGVAPTFNNNANAVDLLYQAD